MSQPQRRILVTSALPYANGHIHIGHLVEYIQTDIWVRFQKLMGHECVFVCADDTHGTAIMNRARQEGRSEVEVIADMHAAHSADFAEFLIEFDNYGSTHSDENRQLAGQIWAALQEKGLIAQREVTQLFDTQAGVFLADRFVKGQCPNCGAPDQYGDNCDKCNATYSATEVVNPVSTLSGTTPEIRSAMHFFVEIEQLHDFLAEWTQTPGHMPPETANQIRESFLQEPLRAWDVSRPAPYFGFPIPGTDEQHYWYVWFDAPIGYMASTMQWCQRNGQEFDRWWRDAGTEIHHFIGKDITYFHTLFWPAMLKSSGFNLPKKVHIHGFLLVNGKKMSKREGTFIRARTFIDHIDPQFLRYYYASKLSSRIDDLDLNTAEFVERVNGDLVGKVVNLASRTAKFIQEVGLSETYPDDGGLFKAAAAASNEIAADYEAGDYSKAMRRIIELADAANRYVDAAEPWKLNKDPGRRTEVQQISTVTLNLFRQITIYLAPVLPRLADQAGELLRDPITRWDQAQQPLINASIAPFAHMMKRVEAKQIETMIQTSKEEQPPLAADIPQDPDSYLTAEPLESECTIDDFTKIDLRVARVLTAEEVPEARKLLKLTVSLGGDNQRQIFAGIKGVYQPDDLVGRLVVIVANLAPRKMKFGLSEGMVTAAGAGGQEIFILAPDSGAKPGMRVH